MSPTNAAKEFWDARAREDAFHFVDSRAPYGRPDADAFWSRGELDLDALLTLAGARLQPSDDVVEIGCGVGRLTRAIAARAATVRALDVSSEMLRRARRHNAALTNVRWVEGDGTSLDGIASASADACISHVVFQHIPDPEVTLGYVREMARVLRPGGWAAFQVSNDSAVHRHLPPRRDRVRALVGAFPRGRTHQNWLGSHIELDALRRTARESGMTLASVTGQGTQYCIVRLERA